MSEEPHRLSHDPRWAAEVAAVKAGRPDPKLLGRVERRLQVDLREGVAPRPLLVRLRWAILLVVFGGTTAVAALGKERWWPVAPEPTAPREAVEPAVAPEVVVPPEEPDAGALERASTTPGPLGVVEPPAPRPRPPRAPASPPPAREVVPLVDPLAAQLSSLKEAQVNLQSGDAAVALRKIEVLLAAHPNGPVAPEARVLRTQALAAVGQVDQAIRAAHDLIEDRTQRGKRGEWWRFIGDLERNRGRCPEALEAYRAAKALPLKPAAKAAVEAGTKACGGAP